ncbi:hypothetical protein ACQSMD_01235 [Streptomyces flavovirens]|uniref:hypothetical protein n=1 Tax=Streptomyces flavovirens TaxID=52258 RepID=UPI003D0B03FE
MSEREGRDWTAMTPEDFDPEAPAVPETGPGPAAPAEPDPYGTPPLFDDEQLASPSLRADRRAASPVGRRAPRSRSGSPGPT